MIHPFPRRRPAPCAGPPRALLTAMVALLVLGALAPLATPTSAQTAAPALTAPADGAVVDGLPLFAWTLPGAPAGATARLEVATDAAFEQLVTAVETTEGSYQQIQALDPALSHRWRVGLIDPEGDTTWSDAWSFTLAAPVEEPTPTLTPEPTQTATEVPATPTEIPTDTPTQIPTATATGTPTETPAPTETTMGTATASATTVTTGTSAATATSSRTATATPTKTATQSPTATRTPLPPGAIPLSKLSGKLPVSSGLPVSGAARSRGSTSSNLLRDRNLATLWTSASTTPADASVTVKLDRSRSIGSIRWMWGLRYHGDLMHIEVSLDQVAWTPVGTVGNAPTGVWQSLSVNAYARYVRFRFENPERDRWVGGLAEVEVYAGPRVLPPPVATPTPHPDGTIVNPGFERGTVAWTLEPGAAVVDGGARAGARSIRLAAEGGYAGQRVALSSDRIYEVSGWGKLTGTPYDVGNVGILFHSREGVRLRDLEPRMLPFTTTDFALQTLRFAVPASVAGVTVTVYKVVGGASLHVDDLALRTVSGSVPPARQLVTCQQLMLPGYFDPATGLWDRALGTGTGLGIAIFNPESGPDTWFQPAYAEQVAAARSAGVRPFAYVYTAYGARPIADVLRDIDTFRAWYGIADIFLDNGATSYAYVAYFRTVMDHIHAGGGIAVVNYGWWPHPAYMEFTDIANIFEDSAAVYESAYVRPSWILSYPADRFSHIVYATPRDRMDEVIDRSRERNAGHVWISDDHGDTLYKNLPTYWPAINQAVREGC